MTATAFDLIGTEQKSLSYFLNIQSEVMDDNNRNKSMESVENLLRERLIELGRQLLQEFVDQSDDDIGQTLIRDDGKILNHKRPGHRKLETFFGEIEVVRTGYGHPGEPSVFPKDQTLELPEKRYSYPVRESVCREASRCPYDEVGDILSEYTGANVPKRQRLEIISETAGDFEDFYARRSVTESERDILVLTGDGKGVVMRPEGLRPETRERATSHKVTKRLSKGERRNRKREAMVASVYDIDANVRTVEEVMGEVEREPRPARKEEVRPENKRVWASLEKDKDVIYHEMLEEGLQRNPSEKTVVFLSDGAKSIQKPAEEILRPGFEEIGGHFIMILDLFHVIEYLWKAAYVFHKEGSEAAEAWVNRYLRMILEGRASVVASVMKSAATRQNLSEKRRAPVDRAAAYILRNKAYMHYDEYLAAGLPIASGVIEGTCKHLVKDRFEITGARWGLEGAESLLKIRAICQSGDWSEFWKFHVSQDQLRIRAKRKWQPGPGYQSISCPKLSVINGGKASS